MKKTFRYIFGVLSMAFLAVSCVETVHEAGEPDVEGCYGVYFPEQDTDMVFDPDEVDKTITISVSRTNTEGAIEVPVEISDTSGVFTATELYFDDGEAESSFEVTFGNIEVGTYYYCSLQITDPLYASYYNSGAVSLDLTVILERWNLLGTGQWMVGSNDFFLSFEEDVDIYQNDLNTNEYRVKMKSDDYAVYTEDNDEYFTFEVLSSGNTIGGVTLTQDDLVYFEDFDTGYYYSSYSDYVTMLHPGRLTSLADESYFVYNAVTSYQEDGTAGVVSIAPVYYMLNYGGGWGYYDSEDAITIVFPGVELVDYSISISTDVATNGELPVLFTCGADVASVKYQVFYGTLNSTQVESYIEAIGDGSETSVDGTIGEGFTINMGTTGVYTIVAVTFDESGVAQEGASAVVNYLAAGDSAPVVVSADVYATGKYGGSGYTSDNTVEYYIYGSELTSVKYLLTRTYNVTNYYASTIEALYSQEEVDADVLAEINGTGMVEVRTDCIPGMGYTLLVYASNGYEATVVTAETTMTGQFEVDDIFGTYSVEVVSYYYDSEYSPETWVLEQSDDQDYDIMITTMGVSLDSPVYGTYDQTELTLSFAHNQSVGTLYGYNAYFMNYYGTNVDLEISGFGKFSASGTMFGLYLYEDQEAYGWYDVYTSVSGTKEDPASSSAVSVSTKSLMPQQAPAELSQLDRSSGTLLPQFCGPREVQTASFTVGKSKGRLTATGRNAKMVKVQSSPTLNR